MSEQAEVNSEREGVTEAAASGNDFREKDGAGKVPSF